ncbi:NADPH-dependent 7-cyano-7-deazaguanine reductase [Rickettsiales endosymbiont of Paramecium tredecaurelia]|uniref:hypothetical protein n=1 Tax=Candidatus Sarmatiella mevalonica TaxID=2770581 RepID=UPI0019203F49|nr:hypothetical protein [Candidatus Sarmatiella mevalonica]MBL3284718.1 NADPH-dependent 7-cyano-7-deazaguanine reductase [Candidatus Sarmatiella mevalonica]
MSFIHLGRVSQYPKCYDASILQPIARTVREVAMYGFDIWNCYELSWLGYDGKPMVAILEIWFPIDSKYILESKSLKLYLNSLNNLTIGKDELLTLITKDLSGASECDGLVVRIQPMQQYNNQNLMVSCYKFDGYAKAQVLCLDEQDVSINYQTLEFDEGGDVRQVLYSNLLKSNCPVTSQPDWGFLQLCYAGPRINHQSLLCYLISLRDHQMFHESLVEELFCKLCASANFAELLLYARYTRRGGIDINPIRSNSPIDIHAISNQRHWRQ